MACWTTWHSHQNIQHKHFTMLGCQSEERFILMKTKHPVHIMVFVWSQAMVILCLRLNTEAYIEWLEKVVLPWIERVAPGKSYIKQQDCVMSHKQNSMLTVKKNHPEYLATSLPRLQSPNFYEASTVVWETNKILCNTIDEMKATIMAASTNLNKENIRKTCRRFQSCLEAMVEANGNLFE